MQTVTLGYAAKHLKELLAEVSAGEEIVIVEDSRPLGRLVAEGGADTPQLLRKAGGWPLMGKYEGQGWMAEDFNDTPACFDEYVK